MVSNTYLAKLARFWMTLAIRVRVRDVRSSGYSCIRLKRLGDMMAGHRKRRNNEALMSRSLMSCFPRFKHCCFHDANTSFSSRGKTLGKEKKIKISKYPKGSASDLTLAQHTSALEPGNEGLVGGQWRP